MLAESFEVISQRSCSVIARDTVQLASLTSAMLVPQSRALLVDDALFSPEKPPRSQLYLLRFHSTQKGFWTYLGRHGWIVRANDTNRHVFPPGFCLTEFVCKIVDPSRS